jgi:ABC-type Zn uptake system ZnuABC Zn-binding protein ZnuA
MAAASAQELAALQEQIAAEGVTAIFVGTTVNPDVAAQIAADTGAHVVPIYTDSLSDATGPASTYLEMMRFNVAAIVGGLK